MPRQVLTEAISNATATPIEGQDGRFLVQIITPGWGSSGYYSTESLKAAAGAKIFAAGTHMYLDHPSASEEYERPERSVKDLAAVLAEDARWDEGLQALVAEATVFGAYRQVLTDQALNEAIGVSIRASAEVETGNAEGRFGTLITSLIESLSVDFVTHAGRGGKVLQVIESARKVDDERARADIAKEHAQAIAHLAESRNIGQWIESRLHLSLTQIGDDMYGQGYLTREERIALSGAVGDALDAFTESLQQSAPQLYQRDLWDDPAVIAAQVDESATSPVPGHPAGQPHKSEEDTMPQIEEARLRQLEEDAGRVRALESERDTAVRERDEARGERDQLTEANTVRDRREQGRQIIESRSANKVEFSSLEVAGLLAGLPLTESGVLDTDAFTKTVDEQIAAAQESAGAGTVRGFGGGSQAGGEQLAEADYDKKRAALFGRKES